MGLDQYFFKSKESCAHKREELLDEDGLNEERLHLPEDAEKFFYFRKNHILNEWICDNLVPDDIWDFNCVPIEISENNVVELFNATVRGDVTSEWEYQNEELLSLIKELFKLFSEDKDIKVYYYAWW